MQRRDGKTDKLEGSANICVWSRLLSRIKTLGEKGLALTYFLILVPEWKFSVDLCQHHFRMRMQDLEQGHQSGLGAFSTSCCKPSVVPLVST